MNHLTRTSRSTLREQLVDHIIDAIESGDYSPGDKLPSVRELASAYGVSRETANLSFNLLRDRGYVEVVSGRGAFVIDAYKKADDPSRSTGAIAFLYDLGWSPRPTFGISTTYENLLLEADYAIGSTGRHMFTSHICYNRKEGREGLESLLEKVDGIMVVGLINPDLFARLQDTSVPIVAVLPNIDVEGIDEVGIDSEKTFYHMANHLIKRRYHRLVYLDGPVRTCQEKRRIGGIKRAMEESREAVELRELEAEDWTTSAASVSLNTLFAENRDFDAVLAVNDVMAASALATCLERGLRIPEDVAITGSKDTILAKSSKPLMTSIDYHFRALAGLAVERLEKRIAGKNLPPARIELMGEVVLRDSIRSE